ncbi:DUF2510 domain-containing protein [Longispora sp. NPDC051575]|uniref:DUF2510 domain-containing protein n=1 Tax=Longispora sp. NPDC051575 TaxID=3154943 RepID=UPI003449203D
MTRAPGWYVDPDGEPAMRYWDGGWTDRSRPISSEDLPPLDFLDPGPTTPEVTEALPVPVSPAPRVDTMDPPPPPPPAVPRPRPEPAPEEPAARGTATVFALVGAFCLLVPVALVCLLPFAWAVRRFADWPGWTVWAFWAGTWSVLAIPAARRALARAAPHQQPSHADEPTGPLAALTWLSLPLLVADRVVTALTGAVDRLWGFVKHLASTGQGRRTTHSTVAVVLGMVRSLVFWAIWGVVALLWLVMHGFKYTTNGLRWVAASIGDRIRGAAPDAP